MDIKKTMLKEKKNLLEKFKIIESYLVYIIGTGEKERGEELKEAQRNIDELEKIIDFLKK